MAIVKPYWSPILRPLILGNIHRLQKCFVRMVSCFIRLLGNLLDHLEDL